MFLCCTRHCCSSSIELVSWRRGGGLLVKRFLKTNPDRTFWMFASTYIFAVILKTPVGVDHLTLRQKDKAPMRETYQDIKVLRLRPFLPSASAPPLALWAALWWSRRTPGSDGYTSSRSLGRGSWFERPASPWRGHVPDRRTPTWRGKKMYLPSFRITWSLIYIFYHAQKLEFFSFWYIGWKLGTADDKIQDKLTNISNLAREEQLRTKTEERNSAASSFEMGASTISVHQGAVSHRSSAPPCSTFPCIHNRELLPSTAVSG